jgi:hypothetical protein
MPSKLDARHIFNKIQLITFFFSLLTKQRVVYFDLSNKTPLFCNISKTGRFPYEHIRTNK